jgi:hypothetical protein
MSEKETLERMETLRVLTKHMIHEEVARHANQIFEKLDSIQHEFYHINKEVTELRSHIWLLEKRLKPFKM